MKYTEAAFRALENKAIAYAQEKHHHQTYGGDKPYTYHLRMVRDNVLKFHPYLPYGLSIEVIVIAAWLHDVIEDCGVTQEDLAREFGEEVAALVFSVTNEAGKNRKERNEKTYHKIRETVSSVFLKLMDRIANIETGGKTDMYKKEYPAFKAALYREGELDKVWEYLDSLLKD